MKRIPNGHRGLVAKMDAGLEQFKSPAQSAKLFIERHTPPPSEARLDGWSNVITGLGRQMQDQRKANYAAWDLTLPEQVAEDLYAADPTARRIIELLPNEATRQWVEIDDEDEDGPVNSELKRLKVKEACHTAWIWARLYGGAGILINDGTPTDRLWQPLQAGKKILSLTPLTRWELWAWATDVQRDITRPDFGIPTKYHMYPRMAFGQTGVTIHGSRLVRFDGRRLPRILTIRNNFWGDSVLTPLYEILGDFKLAHSAVAKVIQDYRVLVAKLEGLATTLSSPGGDERVQKRMALLSQVRSMFGMAVIDSKDDFQFYSAKLEGLAGLLDQVKGRLQAETDIPHTIMFNESPSGLGATGNSEERVWYNHVKSQQENYLGPRVDKIKDAIEAQPGGKKFTYRFKPLWQMDDKDAASMELAQAQADDVYHGLGVKTPNQIQDDRFPELADQRKKGEILGPVVPPAAPQPGGQPKDKPKK